MAAVTEDVDSGLPHGDVLCAFVDAVVEPDDAALDAARGAVRGAVGDAGLVDASAVLSMFQKMTRFADATGIELDTATEMASRKIRESIRVDHFASAGNSRAPGFVQRLGARVVAPVAPYAMKWLARLQKRLVPRVAARLDRKD